MRIKNARTLVLLQILEKYSDEDNPLSTTHLIDLLSERGIESERKSIYADIEVLNEIGFDIVKADSPKRGYFMATRKFEIPEVMLLIDAVSSAGFIAPKKTQVLVDKLKTLMSVNQASSMASHVYYDSDSTKCDNEEIYIIIDHLNDAIVAKKQVSFTYKRRSIDAKNHARYTLKTHTVSPYGLIWKQDHYYLVCNISSHDNIVNLRLDRMKKLKILDDNIRPISEVSKYKNELDIDDYVSTMFNMFSGDECDVTLEFDIKLEEEIIDRFGKQTKVEAVDANRLKTTVRASNSDGFVSWIMQFGDKIKVTSPRSLAKAVKVKARTIARQYNNIR